MAIAGSGVDLGVDFFLSDDDAGWLGVAVEVVEARGADEREVELVVEVRGLLKVDRRDVSSFSRSLTKW